MVDWLTDGTLLRLMLKCNQLGSTVLYFDCRSRPGLMYTLLLFCSEPLLPVALPLPPLLLLAPPLQLLPLPLPLGVHSPLPEYWFAEN